jgi:hypothetical protein
MVDRCVSSLLIGTEFTRLLYIRNGVICSSSLIDAVDKGLVKRLEKSIFSFTRSHLVTITQQAAMQEQKRLLKKTNNNEQYKFQKQIASYRLYIYIFFFFYDQSKMINSPMRL